MVQEMNSFMSRFGAYVLKNKSDPEECLCPQLTKDKNWKKSNLVPFKMIMARKVCNKLCHGQSDTGLIQIIDNALHSNGNNHEKNW